MLLTKKLSPAKQKEVRAYAFSSIRWSARKLVDVEVVMTKIITRMKPALDEILRPDWSECCLFLVVGSVSRMEANLNGDIDVNVCFHQLNEFDFENWKSEIDEKIIKNTEKDLVSKTQPLNEVIGYNSGIDDRLFLQLPSITNSSSEDDWEILSNLLIGHQVIRVPNGVQFEHVFSQFLSQIEESDAGERVAHLLSNIIAKNHTKIFKPGGKTRIDRANLIYKILCKSMLLIAIIGKLERDNWKLSYYRLVEIISEKRILESYESEIIQQSVLDVLEFRGTPHGAEYTQSEFVEFLTNIKRVIILLKDFLNRNGYSYLVRDLN
jgi:hypothetical protein